jgi:flagellar motility protein MotE (MotC chaperone)
MKTRILPIIGFTFAVLLISRAAAFTADASEAKIPETPAETPSSPDEKCLTGIVLETITADLDRLSLRKQEISKREIALTAVETKLATQMTAIEAANSVLETNIKSMTSIANQDIKHLVDMYQTMKPKQAAEIFNSMDPAFAAGFLRQMESGNAGLIMANMDPRKSYAISVIISGRNSKYRKGMP